MCMQLVQRPEEYDVLVLPNLYGDVLSDLCAGMIGGLGMAPGANFGDAVAVFEPTHGSAPKYAGQNKVNAMAQLLSGVLMLRHLAETGAAARRQGRPRAQAQRSDARVGAEVRGAEQTQPDGAAALGRADAAAPGWDGGRRPARRRDRRRDPRRSEHDVRHEADARRPD